MTKRNAVFFDKDGTLVKNIPFNSVPERIELADGAVPALARLQSAGFLLAIVTNQSGVARGYFPETALVAVEQKMRRLFERSGASLAGFYYCPHLPDGSLPEYAVDCDCRKPKPGLLVRAAEELNVDLAQSWMVGDILNDIEAGKRAGCRTILINNGNETEWLMSPEREPDFRVANLLEAAEVVLSIAKSGEEQFFIGKGWFET